MRSWSQWVVPGWRNNLKVCHRFVCFCCVLSFCSAFVYLAVLSSLYISVLLLHTLCTVQQVFLTEFFCTNIVSYGLLWTAAEQESYYILSNSCLQYPQCNQSFWIVKCVVVLETNVVRSLRLFSFF